MSYICSRILPGYSQKSAKSTILFAINSKKLGINFVLHVYMSAYVIYKCSVFTICTPAQSTHLLTSQDTCTISLFITDHINHLPSCVHSPVFPLLPPLHHFLAHFLLLPSLYSIWPFVNVWIRTDGFFNLDKQGRHTKNWTEDYGICCFVIGSDAGSADMDWKNRQAVGWKLDGAPHAQLEFGGAFRNIVQVVSHLAQLCVFTRS